MSACLYCDLSIQLVHQAFWCVLNISILICACMCTVCGYVLLKFMSEGQQMYKTSNFLGGIFFLISDWCIFGLVFLQDCGPECKMRPKLFLEPNERAVTESKKKTTQVPLTHIWMNNCSSTIYLLAQFVVLHHYGKHITFSGSFFCLFCYAFHYLNVFLYHFILATGELI